MRRVSWSDVPSLMRSGGPRRVLLVGVIGIAVAACGDSASEAIATMTSHKDQMCACKDKACADKVSAAVASWLETGRTTKPTKAQEDAMTKIAGELTACLQTATSAPSPASP